MVTPRKLRLKLAILHIVIGLKLFDFLFLFLYACLSNSTISLLRNLVSRFSKEITVDRERLDPKIFSTYYFTSFPKSNAGLSFIEITLIPLSMLISAGVYNSTTFYDVLLFLNWDNLSVIS